jgi:hypothetical protein
VALVGYTNAGKSTLMRALTGSEVLVANKLFATLDTTVRALHPESVPRVLVSDTVGFIKNLPHGLVASFKSTLDEALDASLLLHVIDASDPGFERQLEVTDKVLAEIGADVLPRMRVFNKIDHVGDAAAQAECEAALRAQYPDCVVMSARRPDEVAEAASDDRRLLPAGSGRGRAVPALVGPATARRDLRQLRGAGRACRPASSHRRRPVSSDPLRCVVAIQRALALQHQGASNFRGVIGVKRFLHLMGGQ